MKLLASMSLAALLSLSPALAAKLAKPPAVAKSVCMTPEKLLKEAPSQFKLVRRIEGDDLAKIAKVAKGDMIDTDLIMVFSTPIPRFVAVQIFNKGCHVGRGLLPADALNEVLDGKSPEPTDTPADKPTKEQKNFSAAPKVGHPMSPDDGRI